MTRSKYRMMRIALLGLAWIVIMTAATCVAQEHQPSEVHETSEVSTLDERDDFGSTPRLRAFEFEGTRDPCPWLAVPSAIDFQASIGWERIRGLLSSADFPWTLRANWMIAGEPFSQS